MYRFVAGVIRSDGKCIYRVFAITFFVVLEQIWDGKAIYIHPAIPKVIFLCKKTEKRGWKSLKLRHYHPKRYR